VDTDGVPAPAGPRWTHGTSSGARTAPHPQRPAAGPTFVDGPDGRRRLDRDRAVPGRVAAHRPDRPGPDRLHRWARAGPVRRTLVVRPGRPGSGAHPRPGLLRSRVAARRRAVGRGDPVAERLDHPRRRQLAGGAAGHRGGLRAEPPWCGDGRSVPDRAAGTPDPARHAARAAATVRLGPERPDATGVAAVGSVARSGPARSRRAGRAAAHGPAPGHRAAGHRGVDRPGPSLRSLRSRPRSWVR